MHSPYISHQIRDHPVSHTDDWWIFRCNKESSIRLLSSLSMREQFEFALATVHSFDIAVYSTFLCEMRAEQTTAIHWCLVPIPPACLSGSILKAQTYPRTSVLRRFLPARVSLTEPVLLHLQTLSHHTDANLLLSTFPVSSCINCASSLDLYLPTAEDFSSEILWNYDSATLFYRHHSFQDLWLRSTSSFLKKEANNTNKKPPTTNPAAKHKRLTDHACV